MSRVDGNAPFAQPPAAPAAAPAAAAASSAFANRLELYLAATLPAEVPLRERVIMQERFASALRALGWTPNVVTPFVELGSSGSSSGLLGRTSEAKMEMCIRTTEG